MRSIRIVFATILFLLPMLGGLPAQAGQGVTSLPDIHQSERDPRHYQAITLPNGMTVLLVSDQEASKSLAALAVPVGSLEDPDQQLGLAHYLEHMVLMGSKRYPEADNLAQFLKKHGGSHNASTASYRTAFYLEVENSALVPAVDRLADAIAEPLLGKENADRERNAVHAEMTLARSRDGLRMGQISAETLNPAHPTARFSGGNLETLRDKPGSELHKELLAFYQRYYSANLMVGVIYSNQPLPQLQKLAEETYGRIPNRHASVPAIEVPAATDKEKGLIIHYIPAQPRKMLRVEFRIANNVPAFRSKTDEYISYLIGNRSPGTLSDWLQKQGLAESVSAGADSMSERNSGVFSISVKLTDKGLQQRDQVIAAIFDYLKLIRQQGIRQDYFHEIAHVLDLEFRYPSFSRDMDYIEWLVDTMLRVPVQHVLDAPYLADKYDPDAIAARLDAMTPQQARFWFIGPDEPHNRQAYFVEAPYQVDKITPAQITRWQTLQGQQVLQLPALNPYIPDDFTLIGHRASATDIPEAVIDRADLRAYYRPSQDFADEPKVSVRAVLRSPLVQDTARHQVIFALMDYLAGLSLDQLSYQASVGGIDLSTSASHGLQFTALGFSQHMAPLFNDLLKGYRDFTPTEAQLLQAKSWYKEQLDIADQAKAFELAIQPAQMVSRVPYRERSERRQLVDGITLAELNHYRQQLIHSATPEVLVVGNMTREQTRLLAENIQQQMQTRGDLFWRGKHVVLSAPKKALLEQKGTSSDSALAAVYIPSGYREEQSMAYSMLLEQIVQPMFYNELRTKQQLGYAVFAFAMNVGRQWGLGFLLQSNSHSPDELYQRYQAFYPLVETRLLQIDEDEFRQYRQGLVNELQERPQTLADEANRLVNDFNRGNRHFDSRQKLIARIEHIEPQQLLTYFRNAILQQDGLALLSQVVGKQSASASEQYAKPKGWQQFENTSALQKTLSVQQGE